MKEVVFMLHKAIGLSQNLYGDLFYFDNKSTLFSHAIETAMILLEHGHSSSLCVSAILHELPAQEMYKSVHKKSLAKSFSNEECSFIELYQSTLTEIKDNFSNEDFSVNPLSKDTMLLMCADHISLLRFLNAGFEEKGFDIYDDLCDEKTMSEYLGFILRLLLPLTTQSIYWELSYQYKKLFIKIYKQNKKDILIKTNANKSFILTRENPFWQSYEIDSTVLRNTDIYEEIIPKNAIFLEAEWTSSGKNYEKIVNELLAKLEDEEIKRHVKILQSDLD